jgi:hypothetical protein
MWLRPKKRRKIPVFFANILLETIGLVPRKSVFFYSIYIVLYVCFVDRCLSFCIVSFGHCVVCSSLIYGFWLPLWYLQTLHGTAITWKILVYTSREKNVIVKTLSWQIGINTNMATILTNDISFHTFKTNTSQIDTFIYGTFNNC